MGFPHPDWEEIMSARTEKLAERLRGKTYPLCVEKAKLTTESYKATEGEPTVIRRAKAQAKVLDDPLNRSGADLDVVLAHFLSDHIRRSVGVEEAMSDDLPGVFTGSSVVGFGPGRCFMMTLSMLPISMARSTPSMPAVAADLVRLIWAVPLPRRRW